MKSIINSILGSTTKAEEDVLPAGTFTVEDLERFIIAIGKLVAVEQTSNGLVHALACPEHDDEEETEASRIWVQTVDDEYEYASRPENADSIRKVMRGLRRHLPEGSEARSMVSENGSFRALTADGLPDGFEIIDMSDMTVDEIEQALSEVLSK